MGEVPWKIMSLDSRTATTVRGKLWQISWIRTLPLSQAECQTLNRRWCHPRDLGSAASSKSTRALRIVSQIILLWKVGPINFVWGKQFEITISRIRVYIVCHLVCSPWGWSLSGVVDELHNHRNLGRAPQSLHVQLHCKPPGGPSNEWDLFFDLPKPCRNARCEQDPFSIFHSSLFSLGFWNDVSINSYIT